MTVPATDQAVFKVEIVDIRMRFGSMVFFMVKLAFAAIPALIIILLLGAMAAAAISGFIRGLIGH